MDNSYKTIEYKGQEIELHYQEDPINPREWDNLGTMVYSHSRYILGDEKIPNDLRGASEVMGWISENYGDIAVILPLYIYDHGGITMNTSGFSCQWDSGQVGYIFITKERVRKNYEVKRISKKLLERLNKILTSEVKTFDQYITGQVFGYIADDDSCWGYYDEEDALTEAKDAIDYRLDQEQKKREVTLKGYIKNNVPLQYRFAL